MVFISDIWKNKLVNVQIVHFKLLGNKSFLFFPLFIPNLCRYPLCKQNKKHLRDLKSHALHTWENLAEKVDFLLEVSMRELLVCRLHEVLTGVEEILKTNKLKECHTYKGEIKTETIL